MNTTEIGNRFEEKVFRLLSQELEEGRLLFISDNCKIFRKKGYYSRDRQKNIIVDISIEVYLPDQKNWSVLCVIECKNYNHKVPVDDIEEFNSKLQQIAGVNVKGIIASSYTFQEAALNYAKAKGIGIIRLLDDSNLKWILTRATTGLIKYDKAEKMRFNIFNGLVNESFISDHIDFYGCSGEKFTHSIEQFFEFLLEGYPNLTRSNQYKNNENVVESEKKKEIVVQFISKEEIEETSKKLIDKVNYSTGEVPLNEICEYLKQMNDIQIFYKQSLGYDELGFEILGKVTFEPTIIFISKDGNKNPYRFKFTLAHELGHYCLNHNKYLSFEHYSERDLENENSNIIDLEEIKRMEWQANYFASCLLLPQRHFVSVFVELLKKEGIRNVGFGLLFVDNQACNLINYYKITNQLKSIFRVSRKAIELRLKNLNYLSDYRK